MFYILIKNECIFVVVSFDVDVNWKLIFEIYMNSLSCFSLLNLLKKDLKKNHQSLLNFIVYFFKLRLNINYTGCGINVLCKFWFKPIWCQFVWFPVAYSGPLADITEKIFNCSSNANTKNDQNESYQLSNTN